MTDMHQASYEIWQIKDEPEYSRMLFLSYDMNKETLTKESYKLVYSGKIELKTNGNQSLVGVLDELYEIFNIRHPADFTGHSLSVSDVIVIDDGSGRQCWYVEPFGFKKISLEE